MRYTGSVLACPVKNTLKHRAACGERVFCPHFEASNNVWCCTLANTREVCKGLPFGVHRLRLRVHSNPRGAHQDFFVPWGCVFSIRGGARTQEEIGEEEQHGPSTPWPFTPPRTCNAMATRTPSMSPKYAADSDSSGSDSSGSGDTVF